MIYDATKSFSVTLYFDAIRNLKMSAIVTARIVGSLHIHRKHIDKRAEAPYAGNFCPSGLILFAGIVLLSRHWVTYPSTFLERQEYYKEERICCQSSHEPQTWFSFPVESCKIQRANR